MRSIIKDKKGFVPIVAGAGALAVIGAFILLIVIGILIFTSINKYAVIGGGAIALTLIFGLRGEMNKTKAWFMGVIIVGGLIFLFASGSLQSITGVSDYEDNQGNWHWLVNGIANNVDEGYTFKYLPNAKSIGGGSEIRPQEQAVLYISKKESYCSYQTNKVTLSKNFGLIKSEYYELLSSERVALVNIKDDSGNTQTVDGTTTQAKQFYDNGGKLTFTSLGILGSKRDCESGNNVAILIKDGKVLVKEKSDLVNKFNSLSLFGGISGILNTLSIEVRDNINFLSNFDDYSIKNERFIGDVDIGNVEFTIDADQKYYNSFVYTPPKEVKPNIDSINVQDMKADSTSSAKVTISNRENSEGTISIIASVDKGSVSPQSKNVILKDSVSETFILKAPNLDTSNKLCFEVCTTSSPINCDRDCENFDVDKDVEITCPNRKCESFESYTTCPQDCKKEGCSIDSDCDDGKKCVDGVCILGDILCDKWYQEKVPAGTKEDCGALGWKKAVPLVDCETITFEATCKTSTGVYILAVIIGGVILGVVAIIFTRKPKGRRKKRR